MAGRGSDVKTCKLILLGNGSVGKTSICQRFVADGFQKVYKQTVGLDFYEKTLTIRAGKRTLLQVWDIGGQSISSKMIGQYIWGSHVVFICYDVTDPASFRDAEDWLALARRPFATASEIPGPRVVEPQIYLIGNKVDLLHLRRVSDATHKRFIEENGLSGGFCISAQNGDNVLTTFYKVAASVSGVELTDYELSFTAKVVGVTVTREADEDPETEEMRRIEREDAELEERNRRAMASGGGCGCAIM